MSSTRAGRAAERRARRGEITRPEPVTEAAAAFLAVRPRSVAETRRRLCQLGYPPALVDGVVEHLVELDYLDDSSFATAWVESRDRARPRGVIALRRELTKKGVAREVIDDVLASRTGDGSESSGGSVPSADRLAAERLLERRAGSLRRDADPRKRRSKAYALLARNGFDAEICHEVATAFDRDDGDEEEQVDPASPWVAERESQAGSM